MALKGACLIHDRLLRPPRSGIFLRSFRLHGIDHARETNRENLPGRAGSLWVVLATAIMNHTGSCQPSAGDAN
jgi:hypothetical protein